MALWYTCLQALPCCAAFPAPPLPLHRQRNDQSDDGCTARSGRPSYSSVIPTACRAVRAGQKASKTDGKARGLQTESEGQGAPNLSKPTPSRLSLHSAAQPAAPDTSKLVAHPTQWPSACPPPRWRASAQVGRISLPLQRSRQLLTRTIAFHTITDNCKPLPTPRSSSLEVKTCWISCSWCFGRSHQQLTRSAARAIANLRHLPFISHLSQVCGGGSRFCRVPPRGEY